MANDFLFTSESVSEGHPDKVADQISDAILDAIFAQDPRSRVAAETLTNTGLVVLAGEITTNAHVDYIQVARDTIKRIGYDNTEYGIDYKGCAVLVAAGPRTPFGDDEAQALRRWTGAGGKTLLLLEPDTRHGLDGLLADFGIALAPGALADPGSHYRNDPGSPAVSDYTRHKMTRGLPLSFFPGAAGLEPAGDTLPPGVFTVIAGAPPAPTSAPPRGTKTALMAAMTSPMTMAATITTAV